MVLFRKRNKYNNSDIVALANATMVEPSKINDEIFAQEMLGQTIGFFLKDGNIVAPANGVLEVMFPTGHAFAIRMADGTGLFVHIGIDTVEMKGNGFKVFRKKGDIVKAGERIVKVDLPRITAAGYDTITMLVVTEPVTENRVSFIPFGDVKKGDIINQ